ncbi:transposase [Endozoicomonas sp. ALE010]|uniref:IS701 family transposase n=1 Tax=Endozoicomonas sp. ALE010 TaxID=3403081 RepID=UPI003BB5B8D3
MATPNPITFEAAMLTQEQKTILGKLGYYISFLALALPSRSVPTFCELLVASMITAEGFVTQSWLQGRLHNFWGSYHKWLEKGRWRSYQVVARFMQLCCLAIPETQPIFLVIDDTLVLRFSEKAPGSGIAFEHAHKRNQARYVLGQCFVYLTMVQQRPTDEVQTSIPWLARMPSETGNTSKLFTAKALLRFTHAVIGDRSAYVLLDSWFMRGHVIRHTQDLGYHAIGQVRHDLALFLPPLPEPKRRGRPRIYGEKLTKERVQQLPEHKVKMHLYGRIRTVHYRSCRCRVRILKGQEVIAVWAEFEHKGKRRKTRLILSTDTTLDAVTILRHYALRWPIEPGFNQIKNLFGARQLWQRKRQTLYRWLNIRLLAYGLLQLLTIRTGKIARSLVNQPWRSEDAMTAGMMRAGLKEVIPQFNVRSCCACKSEIFRFSDIENIPEPEASTTKAA